MASLQTDIFARLQVIHTYHDPQSVLMLPHNAPYHEKGTANIMLRFSHRPIDPGLGYRFGRDKDRCDVHFPVPGISGIHFRIDFNWETGHLVLIDVSSVGSAVESPSNGHRRELKKNSTPIMSNDVVLVGPLRFEISIPSHAHYEQLYDQEWQAYKEAAQAAIPSLGGLNMTLNTSATVLETGELHLLEDDDGNDDGLRKAIDSHGKLYVVKQRLDKEVHHIKLADVIHVITSPF